MARETLVTRVRVSTYHDIINRRDVPTVVRNNRNDGGVTLDLITRELAVTIELNGAERIALIEALGGTR
jgi:hypothetical protein